MQIKVNNSGNKNEDIDEEGHSIKASKNLSIVRRFSNSKNTYLSSN